MACIPERDWERKMCNSHIQTNLDLNNRCYKPLMKQTAIAFICNSQQFKIYTSILSRKFWNPYVQWF